jgi:hypothetical protein
VPAPLRCLPGRRLPRPGPEVARRKDPGHPDAGRDPRAGLHRQRQLTGALPQPGRAGPERTPPSPRRLVSWIMSKPQNLPDHLRRHLDDLIASCPEMTTLTARARVRGHPHPPPWRRPRRVDRHNPCRCAAWLRFLPQRPGQGPRCHRRRLDPALQQRSHRGRQHEGQNAQAPDIRPSQLRLATQENPPRRVSALSTPPPLITKRWTEPNVRCNSRSWK